MYSAAAFLAMEEAFADAIASPAGTKEFAEAQARFDRAVEEFYEEEETT